MTGQQVTQRRLPRYCLHKARRRGRQPVLRRALCFRGRVAEGEDKGAWSVLRNLGVYQCKKCQKQREEKQ